MSGDKHPMQPHRQILWNTYLPSVLCLHLFSSCRETLRPYRFYVRRTDSTITRYSFTIRTSATCSSRSVTTFYLDQQPRGLLLQAASWPRMTVSNLIHVSLMP